MTDQIIIRGARLHNLKNVNLSIPKFRFVVLTGISGSGKSTLGFDILHREGQRLYLESLGLLPFGMTKPPLDSISGLSPSISIEQHYTNHSPRSTVGTYTDTFTYLRVLFARLGSRPCPHCGKILPPSLDAFGSDWETGDESGFSPPSQADQVPCPYCHLGVKVLSMADFSFNKPQGACSHCTGLGTVLQPDLEALVDQEKSISEGGVHGWDVNYLRHNINTLKAASKHFGFELPLSIPIKNLSSHQRDLLFYGVNNPVFQRHFPNIKPPALVSQGRFEGVATNLLRRYSERVEDTPYRDKLNQYLITQTCPACNGTRLRPESLQVMVKDQTIDCLSQISIQDLEKWLQNLPVLLNSKELLIAEPILGDLLEHTTRLVQVGAGYLTLNRSSTSLSAGEGQRLRLASILGSRLSGILYVFDEPTIGTHPRDTKRLIEAIKHLRDQGNTILVIEHDLEMIRAADHIIDFGPGAGKAGGRVVAFGQPAEIAQNPESVTGAYLANRLSIPIPNQRRPPTTEKITIHGARHNNLKDITVQIPLGLLVAVSGVAGSGKSSLIFGILDQAIRQQLFQTKTNPGDFDSIEGANCFDQIITINQEHLKRIPRSNTATYTDIYSPIRKVFANTQEAKINQLSVRHFSFNSPGGRCERCKGLGVVSVEMHFMLDVNVTCPSCHGNRFIPQILATKYRGYNISQVLEMTVSEAISIFDDLPEVSNRLRLLSDIGLGYLILGQPATTLSGGEAQRVKLAKELGKNPVGNTLYLLDEPTTGLHLADTARLLGVLQLLVDAGNTVLVIEHNLDFIKAADWVIDLGPEGGQEGGRIIAHGTPEQIASTKESITGQYLQKILH